MSDILQDLADAVAEIEDGASNTLSGRELYLLLSRAVGEIDRLRKSNLEMGWRLNPDRMGGQFTEEEKSRSGWL
jgi:hypothetical protein